MTATITPARKTASLDRLGRPLRDLRISVTDRCNFRCVYCMPKEKFGSDHQFLERSALLSFEEIARVARIFKSHGVEKIRLTGGEPLVRKNVEQLVKLLADIPGMDLTLTTNGSLLKRKAQALKDAGLRRVTISLDGLDDAVFKRMNDVDFPVTDVLEGIEAARSVGLGVAKAVGLGPIKVNMVVKRGTNDHEIIPMARHFRGTGVVLRFIEYMDVGATNGWRMDEVLPSAEVVRRIHAELPLVQLEPSAPGETAERWGYAGADGRYDPALGEIGVISSVTQAFCGDCNRLRVTADGIAYTCLFAAPGSGHDLRPWLQPDSPAEALREAIAARRSDRADRWSEERQESWDRDRPDEGGPAAPAHAEMAYLGG